jgi:hypothetical protein
MPEYPASLWHSDVTLSSTDSDGTLLCESPDLAKELYEWLKSIMWQHQYEESEEMEQDRRAEHDDMEGT